MLRAGFEVKREVFLCRARLLCFELCIVQTCLGSFRFVHRRSSFPPPRRPVSVLKHSVTMPLHLFISLLERKNTHTVTTACRISYEKLSFSVVVFLLGSLRIKFTSFNMSFVSWYYTCVSRSELLFVVSWKSLFPERWRSHAENGSSTQDDFGCWQFVECSVIRCRDKRTC